VQDVFFLALGTLGLSLCFGLLALLSRQWETLKGRWRALPVTVSCPHPAAHAALLTYLQSDQSTGYVLLGVVVHAGHALFFSLCMGVAVILILTLQ
jgi:hypothetical protein